MNSLFSQSIPIRVRVKENINTTEQHINNLTESQWSNAVFNNASFTSSYPGTETPLLKRVYDIRITSDTTLAKQLLLETDYFEYVLISQVVKLLADYRNNYQDNYVNFKQLEISLEQAGLNWFQMNSSQLNELTNIANQTTVYGAENAKAVLALLDHNPERAYSMPIAQHTEQRLSTQNSYKNIPTRKLMSVSPNPANGMVYISYELPDTYKSVVLNMHNAQGKLVEQKDVSTYKYLSKLNVENYTPGIYLLSLVVDGAVVETVKLSINN